MNKLDPDFQFIFKAFTINVNFLDINFKVIKNKLQFDIYHKPTHLFSYLHEVVINSMRTTTCIVISQTHCTNCC